MLKYYDVSKPVTIQADASQAGLGPCLLQEDHPVAYASCAMISAEKNYAQLEKELLAICFACQKFHQYIYGKQVTVQTDHKPLEIILKKSIAKASPRVQCMMLKLQRYTLNVVYKPGREMYLADTLSRANIEGEDDKDPELAEVIEVMVHTVVKNIPDSPGKLQHIGDVTATDSVLQTLQSVIMEGWPRSRKSLSDDVLEYWNIRDELSCVYGLIFAGTRMVIPECMRPGMLVLLHEAHMGIKKQSTCQGAIILAWNIS